MTERFNSYSKIKKTDGLTMLLNQNQFIKAHIVVDRSFIWFWYAFAILTTP